MASVDEPSTAPRPALAGWVAGARRRTLALAASLREEELLGPRLDIVNPPLWELGHVAWFQERWVLRHAAGRPPLRPDADALYDSIAIAHDRRWGLPLPPLHATLDYLRQVEAGVLGLLARDEADPYFVELSVLHEDMHLEAMAFTRDTLDLPAPGLVEVPGDDGRSASVDALDAASEPPAQGVTRSGTGAAREDGAGDLSGDAVVPGGTFLLGAGREERFVLDNEKWAHAVELAPFRIARTAVTQARFRDFVDDGGYQRPELWSAAGWRWREAAGADAPRGWERRGRAWLRREFGEWVRVEPQHPMVHVCWFEAEAWCRWAGRRLPTEAEWEAAALGEPAADGRLAPRKRRWPWGDAPADPARAHLDCRALRPVDVTARPAGDGAFGCRQMIGNVWEWTASDFLPYPGFEPDPYREYSQPWFGTHKVLRGGSFATPARVARGTFRNFYTPDRRDPWVGFRTCAR